MVGGARSGPVEKLRMIACSACRAWPPGSVAMMRAMASRAAAISSVSPIRSSDWTASKSDSISSREKLCGGRAGSSVRT